MHDGHPTFKLIVHLPRSMHAPHPPYQTRGPAWSRFFRGQTSCQLSHPFPFHKLAWLASLVWLFRYTVHSHHNTNRIAVMSLINNLFAVAKAVLADKDLEQQKEDEAKLQQLNKSLAPAPLAVEQPQGPNLGQIVYSTAATAAPSIAALLYHNGYVIVCTSVGVVVLINASTLTVEADIDIAQSLPITAAVAAGDCVVTGHSNGAVYSTSLETHISTLLTSLPSPAAPIVALALVNQSLYIATRTHFYLSLASSTITAAVQPSSATLTAMAVEAKGDVVWLGDADGAVWRLAIAEREVSRLDREGERRIGAVRALLLTPSPLMKKVKKAPAKKKGKAVEEEPPADEDEKEEGGPSLVWCSRGGGRMTVWDTRDGKNSIVMDRTHISPASLATLAASLSQPNGSTSLSLPLTPATTQHNASLSTRSAALLSAPSSSSSSAPSVIHQLLYVAGQSLLVTAHEERCVSAMSVTIEAGKDGAVRVLPDGDNGNATYSFGDGLREAATLLLLVPAEPVRVVAQAAPPAELSNEGSESAPAAAEEQQANDDSSEKSSRPVSATRPAAPAAIAPAAEPTLDTTPTLSSSPYILTASAAGDLHLYPLPTLVTELADRRDREAKRMDELVDGWLDGKNKGGKGKAVAGGKGDKGKKKGADLLSVREERKESDSSALTTARD